jgi:SpoIIAA-like
MHKVVSTDGNVIWVKVSEKLTKEDYTDLTASWEKMIAAHGKMRLVFDMQDFHGWEPAAAWDDLKFSVTHSSQVERIAMIGDKKWEEWATRMGAVLTAAQVRYFDSSQRDEAQRWIREP